MTAPDKIWIAGPASECGHYYPNATEAEGEHGGQAVEYTRSDLIAALAVGVKPLVWEPPVGGFHTARLPFGGKIEIMWDRSPRDGEHYVLHPGTLERQIFPTLKVAQAVAQALYDTAILSALHPASPLGAVMEVPEVRAQSDAMQAAVAKAVEASDKALQDALAYIDKGHQGMARNILSAAIRALKGDAL